jgi:hypothetical protein
LLESHSPRSASELKKFADWQDASKWSVGHLRDGGNSRGASGGEEAPFASFNGNTDRLFDGTPIVNAVRKFPIGFQNKGERFFKIPFRLSERFSLGIYPGNLFDVGNEPFPLLHIDGRKLSNHNG